MNEAGWNHGWRKALRISLAVLLIPVSLYAACFVWRFWSPQLGKIELRGPACDSNRVLVKVSNSGEGGGGLDLKVVDWPWTFWEPAQVDRYVPFDEPPRMIHWSGDGSVIAVRSEYRANQPDPFQKAYDFKNHQLLASYSPPGSDAYIRRLMEERGGIGLDVAASVDHQPLARWDAWLPGRALPAGVMLAGLLGSWWLVRGSRRTPMIQAGILQFAKSGRS
ncbi:hypothetical protein [Haloferula sp. BvORR071]|uniref:hypothetical protein n=1 Tax=Haloferula sp. BvORR071 TaxID=1396141 RepID=UPI00055969D9|nr:hypothetical protein [Haloferula sp. BvORR071]